MALMAEEISESLAIEAFSRIVMPDPALMPRNCRLLRSYVRCRSFSKAHLAIERASQEGRQSQHFWFSQADRA